MSRKPPYRHIDAYIKSIKNPKKKQYILDCITAWVERRKEPEIFLYGLSANEQEKIKNALADLGITF